MKPFVLGSLIVAAIGISPAASHADRELVIRIPRPRIAVGASYMRVTGDSGSRATGLALEGRLVFGRLALVGEIGKDEFEHEGRVDRRVGGSLHWRISRAPLSLYVRAGAGVIRTEMIGDSMVFDDLYGQLGLGVEKRLGPNLSLTAGITVGRREHLRWVSQSFLRGVARVYLPRDERFVRAHGGVVMSF